LSDQPKIEHYTAERIPNPYPEGELPWQMYHEVRNAVLRLCRQFGAAGPMGECPITDATEVPDGEWPLGDPDLLDFFVVDDQYNHERYIYVEVVNGSSSQVASSISAPPLPPSNGSD
jgi:hypothetical protein